MNGLVRKATLLAAGGVMVASCALAAVPSPATSIIPSGIRLVGTTGNSGGTVVDPAGQFTVTVKDVSGNAIAGSSVVIKFVNCKGALNEEDINLCVDAGQPDPGMTVVCTDSTARETTDGAGVATMRIVGAGVHTVGGQPGASTACAVILADGVNLGSVRVSAVDHNAAGGASPADQSLVIVDVLAYTADNSKYRTRSDHDFNGVLSPADTSQQITAGLQAVAGTGSTLSCSGGLCY